MANQVVILHIDENLRFNINDCGFYKSTELGTDLVSFEEEMSWEMTQISALAELPEGKQDKLYHECRDLVRSWLSEQPDGLIEWVDFQFHPKQ